MHKSNIKLIATDFDGTIAGVTKIVSKANMEAIKYARDKGVHVAVLSGRAVPTLKKAVNDFYNDDMILSACNGAVIYRNHNILYKKNIMNEQVRQICDIAKEMDAFFAMNAMDAVHTVHSQRALDMQKRWDGILGEEHKMRFNYYDTHQMLCDNIANNALSVILYEGDNDKRLKIYDKLVKIDGVSVTSSFESNIEVMGSYTTKAYAMKNICDILKIDLKDTMAIGDNYNDIEMIKMAGIGVAMGNAGDAIKEKADFVTKTCDDDGFAYAVYKYV